MGSSEFQGSGDSCRQGLRGARGFGFFDDLAHGLDAGPALRLAAQAPVDLARRAGRVGGGKSLVDLLVAQYATGTDDHAPETCFVAEQAKDKGVPIVKARKNDSLKSF
jgi:hypothetical protein